MIVRLHRWRPSGLAATVSVIVAAGCGTSRWTDTARSATEQLVLSQAIDRSVSQFDFTFLAGKTVFYDGGFVECADKGYISSSIRNRIAASGCLLQEDRTKAEYVMEARVGAAGTDRHDQLLLGAPQLQLPSFAAGVPSAIPEIPLVKKTHQVGAAKLAVFAYNRLTGEPVWQSGISQYSTAAKNYWIFGAGPFEKGTVRKRTRFGGSELTVPGLDVESSDGEYPDDSLALARERFLIDRDQVRSAQSVSPAAKSNDPLSAPVHPSKPDSAAGTEVTAPAPKGPQGRIPLLLPGSLAN